MPRKIAFCNVTIRGDEPLIVPDLAVDSRFAETPLVVDAPHVRFYAGIPLAIAPGVCVGALCVIDSVPRKLTAEQVECLQNLAGLVLSQLRHHASRQTMARQAIELTRKQKILTQTAQLAGVGGFELDAASGALTASDELRRLIGREVSTLDGLLSSFEAKGGETLRAAFARLRRGEGELDTEIEMNVAGSPRHVRVYAETTTTPSGDRVVGIVQDITDRKRATGELEWLATHDTLTRVGNRAAFTGRIEAAIDRADAICGRVALILLDVDRFKLINDTLGHDVGDRVLVAVAERLVVAVGARGTVARLGGDEFGILVDAVEAESTVAAVAGDILAALREPYLYEDLELTTRATLGVAISTRDGTSATALFKEADIALYEAKRAGRDGFALFRSEMRVALEVRRGMLTTQRLAAAGCVRSLWLRRDAAFRNREDETARSRISAVRPWLSSACGTDRTPLSSLCLRRRR